MDTFGRVNNYDVKLLMRRGGPVNNPQEFNPRKIRPHLTKLEMINKRDKV